MGQRESQGHVNVSFLDVMGDPGPDFDEPLDHPVGFRNAGSLHYGIVADRIVELPSH